MTVEEIKMNWLAVCESGSMTAIHNLREHYKLLEKENAELKAHCKAVDEVNMKLRCCENCKNKKG